MVGLPVLCTNSSLFGLELLRSTRVWASLLQCVFQLPILSEGPTKASQGSHRWWTVLLGFNAGATFVEEIFQLCHRQVIDHECWRIFLIHHRMAYGVGLAGNSRVCVLPRRSPDPRVDHLDKFHLQSSSMADGSPVLGIDRFHYTHEHRCRKVPTQIRGVNPYNPHSRLFCHSPSVGSLGSASRCFRSLQNLPQYWELAYTRSLVHDRTHWVCLYIYGSVAFTICQ